MKIKVTETRVYNVPDTLEREVLDAIRRNAVEELDEFLSDLSDWAAESIEVVSIQEVRRRGAARHDKFLQPVDAITVTPALSIALARCGMALTEVSRLTGICEVRLAELCAGATAIDSERDALRRVLHDA
jgi:hypothetical protein